MCLVRLTGSVANRLRENQYQPNLVYLIGLARFAERIKLNFVRDLCLSWFQHHHHTVTPIADLKSVMYCLNEEDERHQEQMTVKPKRTAVDRHRLEFNDFKVSRCKELEQFRPTIDQQYNGTHDLPATR